MKGFVKRTIRLPALALCAWALAGCGGETVNAIHPAKGRLRDSFVEPAKSRLEHRYPIVMPVDGRIARIAPRPGMPVKKGQTLVEIDLVPFRNALAEAEARVSELQAALIVNAFDKIEKTAISEAEKVIVAADEAVSAAAQQVEAGKVRFNRAELRAKRYTRLVKEQAGVSRSQFDDAVADADSARAELRQEQFKYAAWQAIAAAIRLGPVYIHQYLYRKTLVRKELLHHLDQARARLNQAEHNLDLASVKSPIDGVVLNKYVEGDGPVTAGTMLLRVGARKDIEVVADVLTRDALKLKPGSKVLLEPGARPPVAGKVKRIDPAGFTKLSSLGVEQQRVNVIVSLDAVPEGLGVGFRLQARFYTGEVDDAVIVPRYSVLQAPDGSFYVFKVANGKLHRQAVELGLRSDLEFQIAKGLTPTDLIVATPNTTMKSGDSVTPPDEIRPWRRALDRH